MRASENPEATIPEDILVTSARPDIVLVGVDEVTLIELTIPHNSMESLYNARDRKSHKEIYLQALSDFEAKGLATHLYCRDWLTWTLAPKLPEGPDESSSITNETNSEEDYG